MRSWFEFGNQSGNFTGPWSLNSNTKKGGPRPHDVGEYPPGFVQMAMKDSFFSYLKAIESAKNMQVIWVAPGDQGVDPDPACGAEHIPRQWIFDVVGTPPFFGNPLFMPFGGFPIFTENNTFTGSYSDPIFLGPFREPPSEN